MTISYPLTLPNTGIISIVWTPEPAVAVSESPWSGVQQVAVHDKNLWQVDVSLKAMNRIDASPWRAQLTALNGEEGTFLFGDRDLSSPLGSGSGNPLVNGANQVNKSLLTDGWTPGSLVLKQGDMFQVENSLYEVINDVIADGGGNAAIDIWPTARTPSDNASLILTNPKCLLRLSKQFSWKLNEDHLYEIDFSAQEVR